MINDVIVNLVDRELIKQIAFDVSTGVLFEADDETLEMMLIGIWQEMDKFTSQGVEIGEA
jgi:hypothetical protein|tara:strand:+ start:399 stop:578 length:180 start_codon:yes stop_codon:yes gene_type:complete